MFTDSLYTSMAGLQDISGKMQAVASNLANAETPGYEAIQTATHAQFYQGRNAPIGADARLDILKPDSLPGPLRQTGSPLDVGITGNAWLQVQTSDGVALTRNGSLSISASGMLTDSSGNPVLSTNGTAISLPPLDKIQIGSDGTISGVISGSGSSQSKILAQIGLVSTPPGDLSSIGGSLYKAASGSALTPSTNGAIHQGYLNDSNVNPTEAMMDMINSSRSYQLQTELIKNQSNASQDLNTLLAQG